MLVLGWLRIKKVWCCVCTCDACLSISLVFAQVFVGVGSMGSCLLVVSPIFLSK